MDKKNYPRLLSERESREWIRTCPAQVKKIRVTQPSEGADPQLTVITAKCGEYPVQSCTVTLELIDSRREVIGKLEHIKITIGESDPIDTQNAKTMYASATIESVEWDGKIWKNESGSRGEKLPEQDIFWQTDPLYDQIKRECAGVVEAKYKPDRLEGAWRCACGQVNLADAAKCGACGCSLDWLDTHLERGYLEEQKKIADTKTEKELVKEKKRKSREPSDKTKAIFILAGIALVIVLVILTFTTFIPNIRYSQAGSLAENGEYDSAIAIYKDLGDFRDAASQASAVTYKKAQVMTGLEEVYLTTSAAEPWYSIEEDGTLSFNKDKYEDYGGSWNHVIIPDVVDGIIVKSLERNFFINCKELTVVTISDCVEVIGEQAFLNCEMLHTVNFGKNVKIIEPRTFIDCHALEEITIPDTVESLGARAFNNCTGLKKVVLGAGITLIPDYQFSLCTSLESITLCSPITKIGAYAFSECENLKTIYCRFSESVWTEPEVGEENAAYADVTISFDN